MADDIGFGSLLGAAVGAAVTLRVLDTVVPRRSVTRVVYVNQPRRRVVHHKGQSVRRVYVQRPGFWDIQNPYL